MASNFTRESPAQHTGLVRGTLKQHIDLPCAAKIRLESVPLRRIAFQPDALPAMRRVANSHAAIGKHFGIDHPFTHLELSVTTTDLHLQIPVKGAGATLPIRRNLQNG